MLNFIRNIFKREQPDPQPEEDWDVASLPIDTDYDGSLDGDDNLVEHKEIPEVVEAPKKENTPVVKPTAKRPRKKRGT